MSFVTNDPPQQPSSQLHKTDRLKRKNQRCVSVSLKLVQYVLRVDTKGIDQIYIV